MINPMCNSCFSTATSQSKLTTLRPNPVFIAFFQFNLVCFHVMYPLHNKICCYYFFYSSDSDLLFYFTTVYD
ncbi:hypothetical protein PRUPE_1G075300 [Prunus persica]|uniref:Uncharacterized protein n=1 Tax=Prunus persica TaxID=3760 RepID=A0A251QTT7_PRUPE|nr:hypothetical protein PRUPE_1G075300 [Prunus persica]